MEGIVWPLLALALVDSLNPSAIAVTLYLLFNAQRYPSRVLVYVAAIYVAYLAIGTGLVLGLDAVLAHVRDATETTGAYAAQLVVGLALVIYGVMPRKQEDKAVKERVPRSHSLLAVFGLGLVVSVVEFPTAMPYFAAIGLITTSELTPVQWVPLLVGYNAVMVSPPLLLMLVYRVLGARIAPLFERLRDRVRAATREAWLWMVSIVGGLLVLNALFHFEVHRFFERGG